LPEHIRIGAFSALLFVLPKVMTMSNKLTEIREALDIKMRQLAIRAGVSASTICDIERYGYVPRPVTQEKIASALEVEVMTIWPGERVAPAKGTESAPSSSCQENAE
jgi:DNA-binding XRE family transcriptional regulator